MTTLSEKIKTKFDLYFDKLIHLNNLINEHPIEFLDGREVFKNELEQEYIGMILLDAKTVLSHENRLLSVNEFSDERHRLILDACNKLYNSGLTVDIVTVSDYLEKCNLLDSAGGRKYINNIAIRAFETIDLILKSECEK
jgi:hypothetical protein